MKLVRVPVVSNRMVAPGIFLLWFCDSYIASASHPGQFLMVKCGQENERVLRRPFSIHQIRSDGKGKGYIALLFSVAGSGTHWLATQKKGDEIDIFGPLGCGFTIQAITKRLLVIAGGIGISPLIFLAADAVKKGLEVKLLLGASKREQLYPMELIPQGIETITVTEDGSTGKRGLVTDYLLSFTSWADQICACGPVGMYKAMQSQKSLYQKKSVQVSLETRLGCGVGACFGCTIKTREGLKRVCRDGPVFELNEVLLSEVKV